MNANGMKNEMLSLRSANKMLRLQKKKLLEEKKALKRWSTDLHLLNELTKSVVSNLDTERIIDTAYHGIQEIVSCDILSVCLFKQKKIWLFSSSILDQPDIETIKRQLASVDKETAEMIEAYDLKTIIINQDIDKRENSVRRISNCTSLPLELGDKRIGTLHLTRFSDESFSEHEFNIISMVANTLTLALKNSETHREVQEMASIDSLTGIYNKRYFCEALTRVFNSSMRYHNPVSLLMIDIDNFKSVNDQLGHQAGDAVLKGIASILKAGLREIDIPARFGGDEVAIILPETTVEQAFFVARRIKRLIESQPINYENKAINVTASIGISSFPNSAIETLDDMIAAADKALYDAKRSGRNRVNTNDPIFTHDNVYLGSLVF